MSALEARLTERPTYGNIGIGHTRWATHGEPSDINSHPHLGGGSRIAVVHNGIIENYKQLKERLEQKGVVYRYAIALEGSLKLKEISYIHSEAYAGGELKHGTISLVEEDTLVVAISCCERLYGKILSNVEQVISRGAKVLLAGNCPDLEAVPIDLECLISSYFFVLRTKILQA